MNASVRPVRAPGGMLRLAPAGLDAAVKWRRDLLRKHIDERHARLEAMLADKEVRRLADDVARKNQPDARAIALARLRRRFTSVAEFQWAEIKRKPPVACWLYFKVRSARLWTEADDHPRDRQDCASTYFLLAGRLANGSHLSTGSWTIEWSWHSIARLLDPSRSPLASTAEEIMVAAHRMLLVTSARAVLEQREDFLLPVEDGCLRCQADPAEIDGDPRLFIRANSWLTSEQSDRSYARRVPRAVDRDDALGAFWLAPPPLRRRTPDGQHEVLTAAVAALQI
jgi:hypothetical protein